MLLKIIKQDYKFEEPLFESNTIEKTVASAAKEQPLPLLKNQLGNLKEMVERLEFLNKELESVLVRKKRNLA